MTAPLKADQQAAERVLKAAVRRAVEMYREIPHLDGQNPKVPFIRHSAWLMLTAAGESAALLLDERPAKKAAARKGAS